MAIIDYTHETGDLASHGQGFIYRSISRVSRGIYEVIFADLSQECIDPGDQAYKCQKWNGKSRYTVAELKKAGYNFKKPNPLCL